MTGLLRAPFRRMGKREMKKIASTVSFALSKAKVAWVGANRRSGDSSWKRWIKLSAQVMGRGGRREEERKRWWLIIINNMERIGGENIFKG